VNYIFNLFNIKRYYVANMHVRPYFDKRNLEISYKLTKYG